MVISAVSHEDLQVTVDGQPARLAIITEDGRVIAAGDLVAREARSVSINCYRQTLRGMGHLRVLGKPINEGGR